MKHSTVCSVLSQDTLIALRCPPPSTRSTRLRPLTPTAVPAHAGPYLFPISLFKPTFPPSHPQRQSSPHLRCIALKSLPTPTTQQVFFAPSIDPHSKRNQSFPATPRRKKPTDPAPRCSGSNDRSTDKVPVPPRSLTSSHTPCPTLTPTPAATEIPKQTAAKKFYRKAGAVDCDQRSRRAG